MLSRNAILSSRLASALISRGRLPFVAVEAVGAVSRRSQARRAGRVWRCDACHKLSVLSGRVCCGSGIDSSLVRELRLSLPPPRGSLSLMLTRMRTTILFASAVAFMQGRP